MSGAFSLAGCSGGTCIKLAQYLMSMISSEWAEAKGDGLVGKGGSGRQAGKNIFGRRVCPIPAKLFSAIVF